MVLSTGEDVTGTYTNIKSLIDDKKGSKDKGHYFYIIQMPECGDSRIKLGKTANIYARFKYYQEHFHGTNVPILRLRKFNRQKKERFGDNAMLLYEVFESEAKYALRELNPQKTKGGLGILTEWFESDKKSKLERLFDDFVNNKFSRTDIEKTKKREKSTRAVRVDYKEATGKNPKPKDKVVTRVQRVKKT